MMNKQEIDKIATQIETLTNMLTIHGLSDRQMAAIHAGISVLEHQLTNGWIPVSERLPDKTGYYLVTYHEWTDGNYLPKYDDTRVKILRYQEAVFRLPVCCDKKAEQDTHREVIAWMPLPEPWKEVENAGNHQET